MGVRWDSRRRRWWSNRKVAARRALSLIPDKDARLEVAKVATLPPVNDYRGGRPRKPRKPDVHVHSNGDNAGAVLAHVPVGQPFVRTGNTDRRQREKDRRDLESRPEAVMCVPMA